MSYKKETQVLIDNAIELILNCINRKCDLESLSIYNCYKRILAEDIISKVDIPPFNKAAMDGFAYSSKDLSDVFKIIGTIPAGCFINTSPLPGECFRIMTGAPLPPGTDRVIRFEYTTSENGIMKILRKDDYENYCKKGENCRKGDKILTKGEILNAGAIASIAACGYSKVLVYKKPKIGIINTGSELKEPAEQLNTGEIYNSNGVQLYFQTLNSFAEPVYYGIVKDKFETIKSFLLKAVSETDIIILSGGVSKGDFDFVNEVLKEINAEVLFEKVAIKPGRPSVCAFKDEKLIFGLAGNPVSTFLLFELLVKPAIFKLMGIDYKLPYKYYKLGQDIKRQKTKRVEFYPVELKDDEAWPIKNNGPAHVNMLKHAQGFLRIDIGVNGIEKGEKAKILLI